MQELFKRVQTLWSTVHFADQELTEYANSELLEETRRGVKSMSMLLFCLIVVAIPVYIELKLSPIYFYTYSLIAVLALHIYFSAHRIDKIRELYLLGITLLTISATAFLSIAHHTSSFSVLLFANIVLLFMAIPMVPWGVREASLVIFIIYALLTLSTGGVPERFGHETLWVLQFFMLAAAITSIAIVARVVRVRKDELSTRFDLEKARAHLYELSNVDPLTGAWNRRYLSTAISQLLIDFSGKAEFFHYALFDIDDFKELNDTYGHDFGDKVLKCFGEKFSDSLDGNGYLMRFGGDEFALLLVHDEPEIFIDNVLKIIEKQFDKDRPVKMSYGLVSAPLCHETTLTALYNRADQSLYKNKKQSKIAFEETTIPHAAA